ncbi:hypothetical protein [Aliarcobacter cryaerophilus]|uniref:Uncharacterized protein n=1 Tax=Aliarcobacter cryaerophilus TaxID=28198 RepID=A0A2S9TJF4_9BACT|nr:hypothetical protein [Aliarcobacter cryaerophilus]PRM98927.1 hypothetical protein CJ670_00930 [Arcobacter cryaerophilus gv. crypticus]
MKNIIVQVITEKGIYIILAVIGFLSSITTMFIDLNAQISIRWFLALLTISLFILIVFFSILNKIIWEKQIIDTIKIIQVIDDDRLILKTNQKISINSLLAIYHLDKLYEELLCLCLVENIQESGLISIKIIKVFSEKIDKNLIKKGIVKTTIPNNILGELNV